MRYARSVILTLLAKGIALPIGLASTIITARMLGPEGRGVLALLLLYQGLMAQFGSVGLNASITYFLSKDPTRGRGVVQIAIALALGGGVLLALGLRGAAAAAPGVVLGAVDPVYLDVILLSVPFTLLALFLQQVFLARGRIIAFNGFDVGTRFVQLVAYAIVLLLLAGSTLDAVWVMTVVAIGSGCAYLLRILSTEEVRPGFDTGLFRAMIRYGGRIWGATLLMFLSFRIHLLFVNIVLGENAAGVYSVALQFVDLMYIIPIALGQMLFPRVSSDPEASRELTLRVFRLALAGMSAAALVLALLAPAVVRLLFGDAFLPAAGLLQILAPGIVAVSLVTILNNDLSGRGVPTVLMVSPVIALAATVPPMIALMPEHGLTAAAVAASSGYMIMLAILLRHVSKVFPAGWRELVVLRKSDLPVLRRNTG